MTLGLVVPAAARVATRGASTGVAMWGAATRVHVRSTAATRVTTRGTCARLTVRHTRAWITTARSSTTEVTVRGASAWVAARGTTGAAMWGAAARVHVRSTAARITTVRGTAADVTVWSASTGVVATRGSATALTVRGTFTSATTRGSAAGAASRMSALADVIARHWMRVSMSTTGRAVTLTTGCTMASTVRATMILGPTSTRASVMRYIVRSASTRTTSTRGNNSPSGELARPRSRGHRGPAVIERRMQLSVSECRVLVITL